MLKKAANIYCTKLPIGLLGKALMTTNLIKSQIKQIRQSGLNFFIAFLSHKLLKRKIMVCQMIKCFVIAFLGIQLVFSSQSFGQSTTHEDTLKSAILTPTTSEKPRINGPKVFGVRPKSPFIYNIPVLGKRPMLFSVNGLPKGLKLDVNTGYITGSLNTKGTYQVIIKVKNSLGTVERNFKIIVGDDIQLTPALGWNSWNLSLIHISEPTRPY